MEQEIKFKEEDYNKVKNYLDNDDRLHGKPGIKGSCMIYLINDKPSGGGIILQRMGNADDLIGTVSLMGSHPVLNKIKIDLERLTKD